jgi:hypothetical protein
MLIPTDTTPVVEERSEASRCSPTSLVAPEFSPVLQSPFFLLLPYGASLSGVCVAEQSKVALAKRATQDEHHEFIGQKLSYR